MASTSFFGSPIRFWRTALALALAHEALLACSGTVDSALSSDSVANIERACPGTPLTGSALAQCPSPSAIRPGRPCNTPPVTGDACPSTNLLFGMCACDAGAWSCERTRPPAGYDPFPDCPDEGATASDACFLERSTCISAATAACFTHDAPLCTCTSHEWVCP